MTNILQLSIETAKKDLTPKPYCCYCGKPRVKGDCNSLYFCSKKCSEESYRTLIWNYCVICGKKTKGCSRCSRECDNKNIKQLWNELNA
jgi:hypothetical protein